MKEGWEIKKLGELANFKSGKSITSRNILKNYINGSFPCYGGNGVCGFVDSYTHEGEYIIIGRVGALCGNVYFAKGKFNATDNALIATIFDEKYIYSKWFYNLLFFLKLRKYAKGVAQPVITSTILKEISVKVPTFSEQALIVEELDLLNEILDKKRQQLKELDALSQSIFYDMFGDPIANEKKWKMSSFGNEFKIMSGGTPKTNIVEYWENGDISWIGSNMCHNNILYENDGKFITKEGLDNSSAKLFCEGYVLVALVGATIGKTALLKFYTATNQNIAGIDVKANNSFTPEYVFYYLQNLYCLFEAIGGDKFKMANLSFVRNLPLHIPPITLQNEFADKIKSIERQKQLIKASITETQTLLDSRMDYYFN